MKATLILATMMTLGMTLRLEAQSKSAVPAPEFLNEIYYFDQPSNSLRSLEKGKAKIATKVNPFKPAETKFEINGERSSFRLPAQGAASFMVGLSDAAGDPSGWFALYRADVKKGKRSAVWVKTGLVTGQSSSGQNNISYNVKKNGKAFEVVPAVKLEKGEYFFVAKASSVNYGGQAYDVFAFGVD